MLKKFNFRIKNSNQILSLEFFSKQRSNTRNFKYLSDWLQILSNLLTRAELSVFESCPASQKLPQTDRGFWNVTWFHIVVPECNHRLIAGGRIGKDYERNERRIAIGEEVLVGIGGVGQQSRTIESALWEISTGHLLAR